MFFKIILNQPFSLNFAEANCVWISKTSTKKSVKQSQIILFGLFSKKPKKIKYSWKKNMNFRFLHVGKKNKFSKKV